MIIEKKEVNPNTYEEINITIKIEYPNIEYNDWKRTKEFNTDNDICSINIIGIDDNKCISYE